MPNAWLQVLPYTSAVASLVGQTFDVKQLRAYEGAAPLRTRLAGFVAEVFTIVMICALAADAGRGSGVVRGALVGGLSATAAYVLPRMFLRPLVSRLCDSCNAWGKTSIGICVLLGLFTLMLGVNWMLTSDH